VNRDAGYSGKPLWQKLGLKPGLRCAVVDVPRDYAALTGFDLTQLSWPEADELLDFAHVFVRNEAALGPLLDRLLPRLDAGGMLWVSWPKKSSPLFRDLTEDGIRAQVLPRTWVDVKVCAVDADWSGLKLLRRRR
jgi:hypothetical protein